MDPAYTITPVNTDEDLAATAELFAKYALSLGIDLTFQDFAAELENLPGKYGPPNGALLLAHNSHHDPIGCVALRPMGTSGQCEMKRLYVDPKSRGLKLGQRLAEAIILEAKKMNYTAIRLDTLPSMTAARAIYRDLGFVEIEAYYNTPVQGTIFLELRL